MNEATKAIIEAGEKAKKIKNETVALAMGAYNRTCNDLSTSLINASYIKAGDTVEIVGGYRHKGKKAEVHEIGFMLENEYTLGSSKNRYASAHVSLLKKDGSLSKISPIMQLQYLRKV